MTPDPSSLSSGPLFYFLLHSGTFVALAGTLFFLLGLTFGWLTWSRHKRAAHRMKGEIEGLKDEIALLKRTLAEYTSRKFSDDEVDDLWRAPDSHRFQTTPDLVLGSFLATASALLPDAPSDKSSLNPSVATRAPEPRPPTTEAESKKAQPNKLTPLPSVPDISEPSSATESAMNSSTAPANVLKTLIVGAGAPESSLSIASTTHPSVKPGLKTSPKAHAKSSDKHHAIQAEDHQPPAKVDQAPEPMRLVSDPHLGLVYRARPQVVDDLGRLKGVASDIKSRLNELGVYTFKQIALWNDENIIEFSRLLSIKDRIHREHWVEQAKELHFQFHSEQV